MSKVPSPTQISQCRTIESVHKALDQLYQNLVRAAKADWEQLFGEEEPNDACITVRVSKEKMADELAGIPRAGVASIRPPKRVNGKVQRRSA